jgi:hypothetical protein
LSVRFTPFKGAFADLIVADLFAPPVDFFAELVAIAQVFFPSKNICISFSLILKGSAFLIKLPPQIV